MTPPAEVLVDTACVVALLNEADEHHLTATTLFKLIRSRARPPWQRLSTLLS